MLVPGGHLERPEGEWLREDSLLQETEKVTVGTTVLPPKAEKGQGCRPFSVGQVDPGRQQVCFCLGKASSQAGFLPGPRQPQAKEAGGGPQNTELERGGS